jgi:spectinomycin phosphotransferase
VLSSDLMALLGRETYRPAEVDLVPQVDDAIRDRSFPDDAAREVVALWRERRDHILGMVERTEVLGRKLRQRALPLVLCHADLHTWNVIVDEVGELWVIDWDEAILAHKERDLMFVVGGIGPGMVEPHETACFFEGYGDETVDPLALAYYRHAWATQDVGSYAGRILLAPSRGQDERAEDVRIFKSLFGPGEIVDLARLSVEAQP